MISTVLATRWRSSGNDAAVVAISLPSATEHVIAEPATFGRYAAGGYVVFLREGDLYAARVDPSTHRPQGTSVRVVPAVMTGMTGAAQFAISPRGSLLYLDDDPERSQRTLARVDGQGRAADLPLPPRTFRYLAVCGDRLAATVFARGHTDLWTGHLDRAAMTQITREGAAFEPVWSPDCRTITYSWNRTGVANIYTVAIESGEAPRVLFESPFSSAPGSWSADGRWLAYTEHHPETSGDIWLWDRTTGHRRPVIATPGQELLPSLSPDGKYVAYESGASGMFEVEVASIHTGARTQVSVGGGGVARLVSRRASAVLPPRLQHHARRGGVARQPARRHRSGHHLYPPRHGPLRAGRRSVRMAEADGRSRPADADEPDSQLVLGARTNRPLNLFGNLWNSAGKPEDFRRSCCAS